MSDAGTATAASAATTAAATTTAPWYSDAGFDAETVGHIQNRGWDKDVKAAAAGAIKAHREAEKHIGVPESRAIKLPADQNDAAGWRAVWNKLGAPADAKGYDLTGIKFKDGTELDDGFKNFFTDRAAKLQLPKTQAAEMAKAFVEYMDQSEAADTQAQQLKWDEQRVNLKKNWGTNYAINENVARLAVERLGVTKEEAQALESVVGFDKIMEMFRKVGSHIKEDAWTEQPNSGGGKGVAMTKEQAMAKKQELLSDPTWTKPYQEGSAAHNAEMRRLNAMILGVADE